MSAKSDGLTSGACCAGSRTMAVPTSRALIEMTDQGCLMWLILAIGYRLSAIGYRLSVVCQEIPVGSAFRRTCAGPAKAGHYGRFFTDSRKRAESRKPRAKSRSRSKQQLDANLSVAREVR